MHICNISMYNESNTFVLVPKRVTFRKVLIKMQNTLQGDVQWVNVL